MKWDKRLRRAAERRKFTKAEVQLAKEWPSCAVGEGLKETGRFSDADIHCDFLSKTYPELDLLGVAFYDAVCLDRPKLALKVYRRINRVLKAIFGEIVEPTR